MTTMKIWEGVSDFDKLSTTLITSTMQAQPVTPDKKLFYAVYLSKTVAASDVAANITTGQTRTAVVEYSGVVEIAPNSRSLSVTEGQKVLFEKYTIY